MKLSIYKKQLLGFGVVIILIVVLGMINLIGVNKMNAGIGDVIDQNLAVQLEAKNLQMDVLNARLDGKQILISGDISLSEKIRNLMSEARNQAARIEKIASAETNRDAARRLSLMTYQYVSDMNGVIDVLQTESKRTRQSFVVLLATNPVVKQRMDKWIDDGNTILAVGEGVIESTSEAMAEAVTSVRSTSAATRQTGIIMVILAMITGSVIAVVLASRFASPIRKLSEAAKEVTAGNNHVRVRVTSKDEVGELASAFNKMIESIENAFLEAEKKNRFAEAAAHEAKMAKVQAETDRQYLADSVDIILYEMERFKRGDLTVNLTAERDDEIRKLYDGFNQAIMKIRTMMKKVSESVETTASAAVQISSSSEELAAGSQEESAQSGEVAAAVEEMTRTIVDNSRNASKTSEVAMHNGELAKEGGEIVHDTVQKIRQIADVVSKSATTVQRLGASSEQIGEIVLVINDIADQTNLLALNAAIEAARAGEQGRGFAVVADEVRKLAERTTQATKQIGDMIRTIQVETKDAVEAMKRGTSEVDEGITLADKAGDALKKIVTETDNLKDMISQIAAASEEQSSTSEQISKNVETISSVSSESAQSISQIARSTDDLSKLTENLRDLVSKFKTETSANTKANGEQEFDFEAAKKAHKMWKVKLSSCVAGGAKIDERVAGAYKECNLGKWYYSAQSDHFRSNAIFIELGRVHTELHENAAKIAKLCNEKNTEDALSYLSSVRESSEQIVNLLDQLERLSLSTAPGGNAADTDRISIHHSQSLN